MTIVDRFPAPAGLPALDRPYRSTRPADPKVDVDWSVFMATEGIACGSSTSQRQPQYQDTSAYPKPTSHWEPLAPVAYTKQRKDLYEPQLPDVDWSAFLATEAPILRARRASLAHTPSVRSRSSPSSHSSQGSRFSQGNSQSPSFDWSSIQPYDATSPSFPLPPAPHHHHHFGRLTPDAREDHWPASQPSHGDPFDHRNPIDIPTVTAPRVPYQSDFSALDVRAPMLRTGMTPTPTFTSTSPSVSEASPAYSPGTALARVHRPPRAR
eukprot:TRINITY_DN11990_c0_g1_i1.p1 TRINITY_DN11990_c0_g1~~TRINITY_DN11990_c0_g1_i1.p1  ORF type:complete len:274 (-),score=25.41 TRINITY_DN11990_c0_g1_i1:497-1297(-)